MRTIAILLAALALPGCSPLFVLIAESTAPSRDEPSARGAIAVGQTIAGDTSNARDERAPGCGRHAASGDHAYAFVAPATGRYRFHVDARYDATLSIRDRSGSERACNDDWAGAREQSEVELVLGAGEEIEVIVDGFHGRTGSYDLRAQRVDPPSPPLLAIGSTITGTTTSGVDVRTPSCGSIAGSPDVTFRLLADRSGTFTLRTRTDHDGVIALYDRATGAELACNDDDASTRASRIDVPLTAGTEVDVVLDGYHGASGAFELTVEAPPPETQAETVVVIPTR